MKNTYNTAYLKPDVCILMPDVCVFKPDLCPIYAIREELDQNIAMKKLCKYTLITGRL